MTFLVVFLGAGLGGMLRHAVNLLSLRWLGPALPWGTLFVNVSGSLLIGFFAGYCARIGQPPQALRLFLTTGLLGGYTTFSAFSLDTGLLLERGQMALAALYVIASVGLSLLAFLAGIWATRGI